MLTFACGTQLSQLLKVEQAEREKHGGQSKKDGPKSPAEIKYSKSSQRVRGGGARRYDVLQKQRRDFPITAELNTNEANQNSFWGKRPSRQLQNPELTDWRRRCWLTFSHANERDGEHERCGDTRTGLS